jgi:hypothetical protein
MLIDEEPLVIHSNNDFRTIAWHSAVAVENALRSRDCKIRQYLRELVHCLEDVDVNDINTLAVIYPNLTDITMYARHVRHWSTGLEYWRLDKLPTGLKKLNMVLLNHKVTIGTFPSSLHELTLKAGTNYPPNHIPRLSFDVLPESITLLNTTGIMLPSVLPNTLQHLHITEGHDQEIRVSTLPTGLKSLQLRQCLVRPVHSRAISWRPFVNLTDLDIHRCTMKGLNRAMIPYTVLCEQLPLHLITWKHAVLTLQMNELQLPSTLQTLCLDNTVHWLPTPLPQGLLRLSLGTSIWDQLQMSSIPFTVTHLTLPVGIFPCNSVDPLVRQFVAAFMLPQSVESVVFTGTSNELTYPSPHTLHNVKDLSMYTGFHTNFTDFRLPHLLQHLTLGSTGGPFWLQAGEMPSSLLTLQCEESIVHFEVDAIASVLDHLQLTISGTNPSQLMESIRALPLTKSLHLKIRLSRCLQMEMPQQLITNIFAALKPGIESLNFECTQVECFPNKGGWLSSLKTLVYHVKPCVVPSPCVFPLSLRSLTVVTTSANATQFPNGCMPEGLTELRIGDSATFYRDMRLPYTTDSFQ